MGKAIGRPIRPGKTDKDMLLEPHGKNKIRTQSYGHEARATSRILQMICPITDREQSLVTSGKS